jgi:hypothetical protein
MGTRARGEWASEPATPSCCVVCCPLGASTRACGQQGAGGREAPASNGRELPFPSTTGRKGSAIGPVPASATSAKSPISGVSEAPACSLTQRPFNLSLHNTAQPCRPRPATEAQQGAMWAPGARDNAHGGLVQSPWLSADRSAPIMRRHVRSVSWPPFQARAWRAARSEYMNVSLVQLQILLFLITALRFFLSSLILSTGCAGTESFAIFVFQSHFSFRYPSLLLSLSGSSTFIHAVLVL